MLHFLAQTTQQAAYDAGNAKSLIDSAQAFILALTAAITSALALIGLMLKAWHDIRGMAETKTIAGASLQRSSENSAAIQRLSEATVPAAVVAAAIGTQQAPSAAPSNVRPPLTGTGDVQPPLADAQIFKPKT